MSPSWRAGPVNAYPVPEDKRNRRKARRASHPRTPGSTQRTDSDLSAVNTSPPTPPFPFLSLPAEIRTRTYLLLLFPPPRSPSDPIPTTPSTNSLALLRTSHQLHAETTHLLYTCTPFPLFPIQSFPPLPTPLLIPPRHRPLLKSLHLRLGNSWSSPPKSWRVSKLLARALPKFTSLRILKVFVEVDPSEPMFEKYRVSRDFYTDFAGKLLGDVLKALPQVESVDVGGYEFVNVRGPLVTRLVDHVLSEGRTLVWSEENGWRERVRTLEGEHGETQEEYEALSKDLG